METILTTIYQTLHDNPALQAIIADVYQFPAEERTYPYIQFEVVEVSAHNGLPPGHGHQTIALDVHIFSAYHGIKEVNSIGDLVQSILETTQSTGAGNVTLKLLSRTITGQQDTKQQRIRIGTLRFLGVHRL